MQLEERKEEEDETIKTIVNNKSSNFLNNSLTVEAVPPKDLQIEDSDGLKRFNTNKVISTGEIMEYYNEDIIT
jgi:hypothetical protein